MAKVLREVELTRDMLILEIARSLRETHADDAETLIAELERRLPVDGLSIRPGVQYVGGGRFVQEFEIELPMVAYHNDISEIDLFVVRAGGPRELAVTLPSPYEVSKGRK